MNLPKGLHALQVPIPNNPLGFLLSYVIEGKEGHTLIDTGWDAPEAYESLVDQFARLELRLSDVSQIILTHIHQDHSGLANRIRNESGAKVLMHRNETLLMGSARTSSNREQGERRSSPFAAYGVPQELYEKTHHGRGRMRRLNWPEADVMLMGGEIVKAGDIELEVIWTPGHSLGHICLYDRKNRILFAGDHVLPVTTPNISLLWATGDHLDPLGDFLSSFDKLKALDVDVVLPAHNHIYTDLSGRLDEIEHHHETRLEEMRQSAAETWRTPYEIAKSIVWTVGSFESLEDWHKVMAVGETLAHLEFLHKRGRLEKKSDNGTLVYST